MFAAGVEPRARTGARVPDAPIGVGAERGQVAVRRGGDDVLPRLEQRDDVVGVGVLGERLARGVEHDVGVEGQDRRLVVGRGDARRWPTDQFARVDADLGRVVDEQADQLEVGTVDDLAELCGADRAGRPLDHTDVLGNGGHGAPRYAQTLALLGRRRARARFGVPYDPAAHIVDRGAVMTTIVHDADATLDPTRGARHRRRRLRQPGPVVGAEPARQRLRRHRLRARRRDARRGDRRRLRHRSSSTRRTRPTSSASSCPTT